MRYIDGSRYNTDIFCPGFNAAGERENDYDLLIAIGAARDPRRDRVRPMTVTIPVLRQPKPLTDESAPSVVQCPRYEFRFHERYYDGAPDVLCVQVLALDEAPQLRRESWRDEAARIMVAACDYYRRNL